MVRDKPLHNFVFKGECHGHPPQAKPPDHLVCNLTGTPGIWQSSFHDSYLQGTVSPSTSPPVTFSFISYRTGATFEYVNTLFIEFFRSNGTLTILQSTLHVKSIASYVLPIKDAEHPKAHNQGNTIWSIVSGTGKLFVSFATNFHRGICWCSRICYWNWKGRPL